MNKSLIAFCCCSTFLLAGPTMLGCGPNEDPEVEDPETEDPETEDPETVRLQGGVQKGPFVLGSTVNVSPVDSLGNPTGQVFPTQTNSDLGDFTVQFDYQGPVLLEGQGFYFNEAIGTLSEAQLTLRAFHEIEVGGEQEAYINILTHLTSNRVRTLMAEGSSLMDSVTTAEDEFRASLGLGGEAVSVESSGVDLNLLGGDDDGNAYLFALSAILTQLAYDEGGEAVDATLQEFINTAASTLATGGQISEAQRNRFDQAQRNVHPQWITHLMQRRLNDLGSTAELPDLNRVLDSSGDGFPNAVDTCPMQANPTQEIPEDSLCRYESLYRAIGMSGGDSEVHLMEVGNLFGEGRDDLFVFLANWNQEFSLEQSDAYIIPREDNGVLGEPQAASIAWPDLGSGMSMEFRIDLMDVTGNGFDDLIVFRDLFDPASSLQPVLVLENDGSGGFSPAGHSLDVEAVEEAIEGNCNFYIGAEGTFLVDLTDDGKKELLLNVAGRCTLLVFQDENGVWDQPLLLTGEDQRAARMITADLSGDGTTELLGVITEDGQRQLVRFYHDGGEVFSSEALATLGAISESQSGGPAPRVGDFSGDGQLEILARSAHDQSWSVLARDAGGLFEEVSTLPADFGLRAISDLRSDGKDELLDFDGVVWTYQDGTFIEAGTLPALPQLSGSVRRTTSEGCVVGSYVRRQPHEVGLMIECVE